MRTDDLDFDLPPDLIAQTPLEDRSASRLLHYRRTDRSVHHRQFRDLPNVLHPGDLLVFNDARVIPARFTLRKSTGGLVEGLFLSQDPHGAWQVLLRNAGPKPAGKALAFADAPAITATVLAQSEAGQCQLAVNNPQPALELLSRVGRMPLPPYIRRRRHDQRDDLDRQRYQTVYARAPGSVAAPTAGLHFTESLLRRLDQADIQRTFITLHVGLGTFKPITADTLEAHLMHTEAYSIAPSAADAMNRAKRDRRRLVAIGTTAARVLESQPRDAPFLPRHDHTAVFIYPPYQWKHVSALITNFHLPRSTLIALVAAMIGLDEQRGLYSLAIRQRYRFFSYGDAMLIE
jgi:S-adenosylmethionine:tRNA ribosyltransferase-isomerase